MIHRKSKIKAYSKRAVKRAVKREVKRAVIRRMPSYEKIIMPLRKVNAYKYLGILKIKEDPKLIQSRMRDEWD